MFDTATHPSLGRAIKEVMEDGFTVEVNFDRTVIFIEMVLPVIHSPKRVEVYAPRVVFQHWRSATVNWSSIGSVTCVDAEGYGNLLLAAAKLADAWDADEKGE